jgi:hypothetical protein
VDARLHQHLHAVGASALKLRRVLDDVDAIGRVLGDDLDQRVGEGRLARAGPAPDEDVVVRADGARERGALPRGKNPARDVVLEREDDARGLSERKDGRVHDRRDRRLKARSPRRRQLRRQRRALRVELDPHLGGDQAQHPLGVGRTHGDGRPEQALADPVDPDDAVGVEHHLDDAWIVEEGGERSERTLEGACAPGLALTQLGGRLRCHLHSSSVQGPTGRKIDR